MLKYVLAGTTALAIAGASIAYAQQPGGRGQGPGPHAQWKAEDIAAFGDARIAALKAGLKLTAEQEKNWSAVEAALRDLAKQRADRFSARQAQANANPPATVDPVTRLGQRADQMAQNAAGMKKLADAAGPLYKSLDDSQKQRFAMLARLGMGQGRGDQDGWRQRGHDGRGDHRGPHQGPMMGPQGGPGPR